MSPHPRARRTDFYHGVGVPTTPTVRDSDPLSWIETFGTFCGMVGLQAMVLGRLGRKPSLIQERVLYPAQRHLRAGAPTIPPRVRGSGPSLCPAPIAYAATTSEGATRTTIPDVWTNY
jgi:hypothetical protein